MKHELWLLHKLNLFAYLFVFYKMKKVDKLTEKIIGNPQHLLCLVIRIKKKLLSRRDSDRGRLFSRFYDYESMCNKHLFLCNRDGSLN